MLLVTGTRDRAVALVRGRLGVGAADHARRLVARGHRAHAARRPRCTSRCNGVAVAGVLLGGRALDGRRPGRAADPRVGVAGNLLTAVRHHTKPTSCRSVRRRRRSRRWAWSPGSRSRGGCGCARAAATAWVPLGAGPGAVRDAGGRRRHRLLRRTCSGWASAPLFGVGWAVMHLKRGWRPMRPLAAGADWRRHAGRAGRRAGGSRSAAGDPPPRAYSFRTKPTTSDGVRAGDRGRSRSSP